MFSLIEYNLFHLSLIIASAGGGGSGGGGGVGGGLIFLSFVGYIPMHLMGAWIRKAKKNEAEWIVGQIIAWIICIVFTAGLLLLGIYVGILVAALMAFGAPLGMGAGLYKWFAVLKQSTATKKQLLSAEQNDQFWNEETILANTKAIFLKYQKDWTNYNTESMKTYMTQDYHYHASLMIYALQLAGRCDQVNDLTILNSVIISMYDSPDNNQDTVVVGFTAQADDRLIDTKKNEVIFFDGDPFTEYWRFVRNGNSWLLYGIQPGTANKWRNNPGLEQFAASQRFYYSLDWGWLLLPERGQLFDGGAFGFSDINNHIIGMHNNILIQMYTYIPTPKKITNSFLIAQAYVPKNYGDIVVRRKKSLHLFGIKGLNKISMEWTQFNDKYEVFASDVEQVTSFELLDPVFMEQLEALPFEVNIEVVDNVVYLYAPEDAKKNTPDRYVAMLGILQKAFQAMRL